MREPAPAGAGRGGEGASGAGLGAGPARRAGGREESGAGGGGGGGREASAPRGRRSCRGFVYALLPGSGHSPHSLIGHKLGHSLSPPPARPPRTAAAQLPERPARHGPRRLPGLEGTIRGGCQRWPWSHTLAQSSQSPTCSGLTLARRHSKLRRLETSYHPDAKRHIFPHPHPQAEEACP